ncbi:MAG: nitrilase-related carbon-nitrogen hydrolase, partial [Candidatus Planktophila sp.]
MKSAAGQYRLRIALAAINPTVGDLAGNSAEVARAAAAAAQEGAHLIVFPEMVLTGYPIEDLALRSSFRHASKKAIAALATDLAEQGHGDLVAIVGYLDETPDGRPQNVAAVIHGGQVKARYI